jgi:prepilin-type N-terminal cleavage/methylation domain-containing protein
MRRRRHAGGFTLIEAMVVVVILGILVTLGVVGYRKWILTSYMAEAYDMIAHIRAAEETFKAENGVYLDVSGGLGTGHLYPVDQPGAFKTAWKVPCGCTFKWMQLNFQPQAPTAFVYAVQADPGSGTPTLPLLASPSTTNVNLSAMQGSPWYVVQAKGDINGDGIFTNVYGFSATPQLLVDNEGN